jgi:hypothetical protein
LDLCSFVSVKNYEMKKLIFVFVIQFFIGLGVFSQDELVEILLEMNFGDEIPFSRSKQMKKEKSNSQFTDYIKIEEESLLLNIKEGILENLQVKTNMETVVDYYIKSLKRYGACEFGYLVSGLDPTKIISYEYFEAKWKVKDTRDYIILKASKDKDGTLLKMNFSKAYYKTSGIGFCKYQEISSKQRIIQLHVTDQNSTAFIPFDIGIVPFHGYFTNEELPLREDVEILVNKIEERGMLEFKASNGWDYKLYFHTNKGGFPVKVEIENISSEEAYEIIDSFIQFQGCFPWPFRRTEYIKDGPLKEQKAGGIHHLSACFQQTFPAYRVWFDYDPLFKRLTVKKEITQSEYRTYKEATDFCPFTERDNLRCVNISEEEWEEMQSK